MAKEPHNEFHVTQIGQHTVGTKGVPLTLTRAEARNLGYWLIKIAGPVAEEADGMTEALRELINAPQGEAGQPTCMRCGKPRPVSSMPWCGPCYQIVATELGKERY